MKHGRILIADDDKQTRDLLVAFLTYKGYHVEQSSEPPVRASGVNLAEIDLVITSFAPATGEEMVKELKGRHPEVVVIGYSSCGAADGAPEFLKAGGFFFLEKPVDLEELNTHVKRGLEQQALRIRTLKRKNSGKGSPIPQIVGESEKMLSLFELIERVAQSDSTVLLQGESGTGKELVARAIHDLSSRRSNSFVPVNCGAIPDDLLESELFGHVKGAFTGAIANRMGRFELANKGSIFLDEIGDMKANLQVKLLRVLQSRELEVVGAVQARKIDVRIIAATNQDLERMVEERTFREDLFYRLSVIPIVIPPLRERKVDISLLIEHFLRKFCNDTRRDVKGLSKEAMEVLCSYDWPGNVRELENLVERLVILKGSGFIGIDDLPEKYLVSRSPQPSVDEQPTPLPANGICLSSAVEEFENRLILQALEKTGGNKKEAATLLNLKRTTFIEKLKKKKMMSGGTGITL